LEKTTGVSDGKVLHPKPENATAGPSLRSGRQPFGDREIYFQGRSFDSDGRKKAPIYAEDDSLFTKGTSEARC
jgi:hypothetical protein